MNKTRFVAIATAMVTTVTFGSLVGPSNIDSVDKWSWGENIGWMNWRDANATNSGVVLETDHLHGSIWAENIGWINVGNGGGPYANTTGLNFGVNRLGNDDLDGMAWSENRGWVNFGWAANTANPDRARFDALNNRFRGFAWGENIGWINLDDNTHFPGVEPIAPPMLDAQVSGFDKQRFISLVVPVAGVGSQTAIRIKLVSLHHPTQPANAPDLSAFEGQFRYLNAFRDPNTNAIITDCPDSGSFLSSYKCAAIGCAPEYLDWATLFAGQVIHATGDSIVPTSEYAAVQLAASCTGVEASCAAASLPLSLFATRWGDANGDGLLTVNDVTGVVDRVKDLAGALAEQRVLVRAEVLLPVDWKPNVLEITNHVDALKNKPYPFAISSCP